MKDKLVFRIMNHNDNDKFYILFKNSFNKTIDKKQWLWFDKFCPTGQNRTYVIDDIKNDCFAGSYSLLPIQLILEDKLVNVSLCTNVNIHPSYRNQGLFVKLGKYALDSENNFDTPISIGMPNKNAFPGHMKVGWNIISKLPFLYKKNIVDKEKNLNSKCIEIDYFNKDIDTFIKNNNKKYSFIINKNHRWLNWRYSKPNTLYKKYVYNTNKGIMGYMVLKKYVDNNIRKAHIIDIQVGSKKILIDFIDIAERYASDDDIINLWSNDYDLYQKTFLQYGYKLNQDNSNVLIIHYNNKDVESFLGYKNIYFCLGDNDVY